MDLEVQVRTRAVTCAPDAADALAGADVPADAHERRLAHMEVDVRAPRRAAVERDVVAASALVADRDHDGVAHGDQRRAGSREHVLALVPVPGALDAEAIDRGAVVHMPEDREAGRGARRAWRQPGTFEVGIGSGDWACRDRSADQQSDRVARLRRQRRRGRR